MQAVTNKRLALLITLVVAGLFIEPGVRHPFPHKYHSPDSFPISTFPMFRRTRPELHRVTWVRALGDKGDLGPLRASAFNPGGMNQTLAHVMRAQTARYRVRREMCEDIASKIAGRRRYRKVTKIQIVDAWYRPSDIFGPERIEEPARSRVLVTCSVERSSRKKGETDTQPKGERKK